MKKTALLSLILLTSLLAEAGERGYPNEPPEPFIGPLVKANDPGTYGLMRYDSEAREYIEKLPVEARSNLFDYGECFIDSDDHSSKITESTSIMKRLPKKTITIGIISLGGDVIYRYVLKRPFEALIKKVVPLTDKEIMGQEESPARKNAGLGSRIAFDVLWFCGTWGIAAACGLL